jgi:predicted amidohydrolase YtcJ
MRHSWLAILALVTVFSCSPSGPGADLILRGGRIYTVDPQNPWAEAVAIREERLSAVGSDADMDRFIGRETVVVELDGKLALPGLIDSHIHFLDGSLLLERVQLDEARSLEEMKEIVRLYAEANPDLPWIVGHGWNYTFVDGGRLPTRQDLDEIVPDRPVFLTAYDGHTAWVNSKALEVAGVDRESEPEGPGEIVRDPTTGEPTGALKEEGAMQLVRRSIPRPSRDELLTALRNGMAYAHRFGITSIQTPLESPPKETLRAIWIRTPSISTKSSIEEES